ncbi:MAG: hypothetical protein WBA12_01455 [Catalinimonas sp.]
MNATRLLNPTRLVPTAPAKFALSGRYRARTWMRTMYLLDAVGTGVAAVPALVAPRWTARHMFKQNPPDPVVMRLIGSVWLATTAACVLGLRHPLRFSPVFAVTAAYKITWLLVTTPEIIKEKRTDVLPLATIFILWATGSLAALPTDYLFGAERVYMRTRD